MKSVYEACFYGGLILAILLFITAIVLFIVLKIPKVFGDLTGRNARKTMKDMKEGVVRDNSLSKKEQAKYYNQGTGKIKVRETVSEEKRKENRDNTTDNLIAENIALATEATEVLSSKDSAVTDSNVSFEEKTDVLRSDSSDEETSLLTTGSEDDATDVLTSNTEDDATDVLTSDTDNDATDVLTSDTDNDATDILTSNTDNDATDVLTSNTDNDATDVLTSDTDSDATDVLTSDDLDGATDVLRADVDNDSGSTTVLTTPSLDKLARRVRVIYNIIEIHTEERL